MAQLIGTASLKTSLRSFRSPNQIPLQLRLHSHPQCSCCAIRRKARYERLKESVFQAHEVLYYSITNARLNISNEVADAIAFAPMAIAACCAAEANTGNVLASLVVGRSLFFERKRTKSTSIQVRPMKRVSLAILLTRILVPSATLLTL